MLISDRDQTARRAHQLVARAAKPQHPPANVAERERGRVRVTERIGRAQRLPADLERPVDLACKEMRQAQQGAAVDLSILPIHVRRRLIALGQVERKRSLEMLSCQRRLAFSEHRHRDEAVTDHLSGQISRSLG